MPGCSAMFCKNRSYQGYLLHVFPRDPKRRAIWTAQVKRDNWEPTNCCYLCEAHFEDIHYELRRMDGKVKLKPCAVPTRFRHTAVKPAKRPRFLAKVARTDEETRADDEETLITVDEDEDRSQEERTEDPQPSEADAPLVEPAGVTPLDGGEPSPVLPPHFVSVPMAGATMGDSSQPEDDFQTVKHEPEASEPQYALTYARLRSIAREVRLPSPAWAVHLGSDHLSFVHARLEGAAMLTDALVFRERDDCRAIVYLRGRRVLVGMGAVGSAGEVEELLERLDCLPTQP